MTTSWPLRTSALSSAISSLRSVNASSSASAPKRNGLTSSVVTQISVTQICVTPQCVSAGRGQLGALLVPGEGVAGVVEVARERRQLQRPERVAHHRELLGAGRAERLLDQARLRAVR